MAGLLTHETEYRGSDAIQRLSRVKLCICGAGAVGSNLVDNLCRQGLRNFRVIDFDRIEEHNVGTQIYGRKDVGSLKVDILQSMMFRETGVNIEVLSKRLDERNINKLVGKVDCIVDAFDNAAARRIVTDYAAQSGIPCLHVGLDADYGEVCWNDQYVVPSDRPNEAGPCDYPMARNIVMLAVIVASESLIDFCLSDDKKSYHITLRDRQVRRR